MRSTPFWYIFLSELSKKPLLLHISLNQCSGRHWHWHHAVCLHPAVSDVQVLGVQVGVPFVRLQVVEGVSGDVSVQAEEGRLHLGQPRAEGV